jgi:hypothetical protein
MPASAKALAPATRKARDEVKSSIWLTVGVSTLVRVSRWLDAVALSLGAGLCHISSMGAWAPCRIGGSWVVFRNDVIAVSAEPDVTMVIDKTAMHAAGKPHSRMLVPFGSPLNRRNRGPMVGIRLPPAASRQQVVPPWRLRRLRAAAAVAVRTGRARQRASERQEVLLIAGRVLSFAASIPEAHRFASCCS